MTISSVKLSSVKFSCVVFFLSFAMSGCGGGGTDSHTKPPPVSDDNPFYTVTMFVNPTPAKPNQYSDYGRAVKTLRNGNFIVNNYLDSSLAENGGAVFLYSPDKKEPLVSFYGDDVDDTIGSNRVLRTHGDYFQSLTEGTVVLTNDNFVIASPSDSSNGLQANGSVMLINGQTGEQIGSTFYGEHDYDGAGLSIYPLSNGNFVLSYPYADAQGIKDTGSVMFIDGNTGQQIGETITGQHQDDYLGYSDFYVPEAIRILPNGNILIVSQYADTDELFGAGSVMLIDGQTYQQVGNTIFGSEYNSLLGRNVLQVLANSNIIIGSAEATKSINLIDGKNAKIINDVPIDLLVSDITEFNAVELGNDKVLMKIGTNNAQSIKLLNALTGEVHSSSITFTPWNSLTITPLPNHNVVVSNAGGKVNGVVDAGFAMLFDGESLKQIGDTLSGSIREDFFSRKVLALANSNVVIASPAMHVGEFQQAGSLMLLDGASWQPLMPTIYGTRSNEALGQGLSLMSDNKVAFLKGAKDNNDNESQFLAVLDGNTGTLLGETKASDKQDSVYSIMQELDNRLLALNASGYGLRLYELDRIGHVGDISCLVNYYNNGPILLSLGEGYYLCSSGGRSAVIVDSATGKQVGEKIIKETQHYTDGVVLSFAQSTSFLLSVPEEPGNGVVGKIIHVKIK